MITTIKNVIKRDGTEVPFDKGKIAMAIYKAMLSVKMGSMEDANRFADMVTEELEKSGGVPNVESIQDTVENILMTKKIDGKSYIPVAKSYILYREKRKTIREEKELLGVNGNSATVNATLQFLVQDSANHSKYDYINVSYSLNYYSSALNPHTGLPQYMLVGELFDLTGIGPV
jgi:anaerobic ribonucleoside-triphosphate reductase